MALWAAALLFYWRAVAQRRRRYWYALRRRGGVSALITTEVALDPARRAGPVHGDDRARPRALDTFEAWIAAAAVTGMVFVHFVLLERAGVALTPAIERLRIAGIARRQYVGLAAAPWRAHPRPCRPGRCWWCWRSAGRARGLAPAPAIARAPVAPFAVTFVKTFALRAGFAGDDRCGARSAMRCRSAARRRFWCSPGSPSSSLAGNSIELHHQRILGFGLGRPPGGARDLGAGRDRAVAVDDRH